MSDLGNLLAELRLLQDEATRINERIADLTVRVQALEFEVVEPSPVVNQGPLAGTSGPPPASSGSGGSSGLDRTEIAREAGRFFVRCLAGGDRGVSGQGRVKLQKRIYVVVRDIAGKLYTQPVRVFSSFSSTKLLVADRETGEFGDSIFCGFASQWEAKIAVGEAGLSWPSSINN